MTLPLTLVAFGRHVCTYVGPCGVVGTPALQQFDLTAFPKNVRDEPGFREQLWAIWKRKSVTVLNVNPNQNWKILPAEGLPETLEVEIFSTDPAGIIELRLEAPHTIQR